jgi:RimJ/RimL family protein N-acetyltransferase
MPQVVLRRLALNEREIAILETDRLVFRTHEPRDEDAFVRMHTDPEVRRYVGGRAWSQDEAISRYRSQFLNEPHSKYGLWAAIFKADNAYAGMSGLSGTRSALRLGFYFARAYWGIGLASEAARAFVRFGFYMSIEFLPTLTTETLHHAAFWQSSAFKWCVPKNYPQAA